MKTHRTLSVTRSGLISTFIVLTVALVCVRFGLWQLDRLDQRRTANALIQTRAAEPPVVISAALEDSTGLLDRRAVVQGRFDNDHSIVLPGRSLRGSPGVYVLTPLILGDGPAAILVNRGWVPSMDAASVELDSLRETNPQHIEGLIQAFPSTQRKNARVERADNFRTHWFTIDPVQLRAQFPYPLLPMQLQALPSADAPEYPKRLEPPTLDDGPHLNYALQWFSFATIAIVGWLVMVFRKGDSRREKPVGHAEASRQ